MIDDTCQIWKVTVELDGDVYDAEMDIKTNTLVLNIGIRRNQSEDTAQRFTKRLIARDFGEGILKHIKRIKCEKAESAE